jgi:cytochrome oxidase assembly protein ShyY1
MRTSDARPPRRTLLTLLAFAAFALLVTLGVWQLTGWRGSATCWRGSRR